MKKKVLWQGLNPQPTEAAAGLQLMKIYGAAGLFYCFLLKFIDMRKEQLATPHGMKIN